MSDSLYFIDRGTGTRLRNRVMRQRLDGTYVRPNETDYTMLALYGVAAIAAYYALIRR